MLQNQNYEAFLLSVSLHILRISPYFTVEILVWSFKFIIDFYSHHDAGCHDNKQEKSLLISPWQKHINNRLISRNWPQCMSCIYLMSRDHNASVTFATVVVRFICLRSLYDFFGIVGGYRLRRMCLHCLRSPYETRTKLTETLWISYDNHKVIVQSSCYLHDLPI